MDKVATLALVILATVLGGAYGRPAAAAGGRARRQSGGGFTVISNGSVPCEQISPMIRRATLTDSDKMELFSALGGHTLPSLMADDMEMAHARFSTLLPTSTTFKEKVEAFAKANGKSGKLLRSTVVDFLRHQKITAHSTGPTVDSINALAGNHTEEGAEIPKDNGLKTLKRDIAGKKGDVELELVLAEDLDIATEISNGDNVMRLDMCQNRGQATPDGQYKYMCTTCSSWTNMGTSTWPEVMNEASCVDTDSGCLKKDDIWQGKCQAIEMPIEVLEKQPGQCVIALKDGATVVVDDWQIGYRTLRVGCECVVKKNSYFVQYL